MIYGITHVLTINGVGIVMDYHSGTNQYQIKVNGTWEWYLPSEFEAINGN